MTTEFNRPELPALGIVADLEEDDRVLLSNYGEFLPVQAGQLLIEEGGPQDSLYFVISGLLHVHTLANEKPLFIARVEAGESLGEINLFDPSTASASVTAKEFSSVWRATRADMELFLESYPAAAARLLMNISREMSRRIRKINAKVASAEMRGAYMSLLH